MNYYAKAWQNYAKFSGRATRPEYWYFVLVNVLISIGVSVFGTLSGNEYMATGYSLATFIPSLSVAVRRMHDVGKSGWFILIPVYNIILACRKGEALDNEYGAAL